VGCAPAKPRQQGPPAPAIAPPPTAAPLPTARPRGTAPRGWRPDGTATSSPASRRGGGKEGSGQPAKRGQQGPPAPPSTPFHRPVPAAPTATSVARRPERREEGGVSATRQSAVPAAKGRLWSPGQGLIVKAREGGRRRIGRLVRRDWAGAGRVVRSGEDLVSHSESRGGESAAISRRQWRSRSAAGTTMLARRSVRPLRRGRSARVAQISRARAYPRSSTSGLVPVRSAPDRGWAPAWRTGHRPRTLAGHRRGQLKSGADRMALTAATVIRSVRRHQVKPPGTRRWPRRGPSRIHARDRERRLAVEALRRKSLPVEPRGEGDPLAPQHTTRTWPGSSRPARSAAATGRATARCACRLHKVTWATVSSSVQPDPVAFEQGPLPGRVVSWGIGNLRADRGRDYRRVITRARTGPSPGESGRGGLLARVAPPRPRRVTPDSLSIRCTNP